jgi:hypothetical protein
MIYLLCILFSYTAFAIKLYERAWVDIPDPQYVLRPFNVHPLCVKIHNLIIEYHKLDKTKFENLRLRAEILKKIHTQILDSVPTIENLGIKKELTRLADNARKKAWYLNQIEKIYAPSSDEDARMKSLFHRQANFSASPLLCLVNNVLYDFKLPSAWGLFWLEALDPCHRLSLTPYYLKWIKERRPCPFFLWLENEEMPFYTIQVEYFDKIRLKDFCLRVSSQDHLFYNSRGDKANYNEDKEYLYVITPTKEIAVIEASDEIRHTTLTCGEPVLGAGSIKIKEGVLSYIDVESGHYQPDPHFLLQSIMLLKDMGLKINYDEVRVKYYSNEQTVEEKLSEFLFKYKDKLPKDDRCNEIVSPHFKLK